MWAQIVNVVLGIWLLMAPWILGYSGSTADTVDRVVGPIVLFFAILAIRQVTRTARFALLLPSLFLILSPWLLRYSAGAPVACSELVGMAIAILAVIPGRITKQTGGGWLALAKPVLPPIATEAAETLREG